MAMQTTLEEIVEMARDEARLSSATSKGIDHLNHIKRVIRRHYQLLCDGYDWEHLRITREDAGKDMAAGQRYYDFPAELNLIKALRAWHFWGGQWRPLSHGITPAHYSIFDSDADARTDPVDRWDFYGDSQFEVWPLPASASGEVRFEGTKLITPLTSDEARADMDDILLSLLTASTLLNENEQTAAANERLSAANSRLAQLRAGLSDRSSVCIGMGNAYGARRPRTITHVNKSS